MIMAVKLRGDILYNLGFGTLTALRDKGLWYASRFLVSSFGLIALKYTRMFHEFMRWRRSPKISEERCHKRNGICIKCPSVKVVQDGRYRNQDSYYCTECGCTDNRWSELTLSKNTREKHDCPEYKFPEQSQELKEKERVDKAEKETRTQRIAAQRAAAAKPGCKTCGGGVAGNGRGRKAADWQTSSGLLWRQRAAELKGE